MKTERCRTCNHKLIGKTAIDVGYCLDCYNNMMVDEDYDDSDDNFQECDECDGHDACRDFGCAINCRGSYCDITCNNDY